MADPKRTELKVERKRAILAGVILPDTLGDGEQPLDELRGLVETAGVDVVGELTQKRQSLDPTSCLGSGKLEELNALLEETKAELVIFDNNLSPAQGRNIEKSSNAIIVDRSEVILDIFASSARTYEAKLQVELAQLLYQRPRLKRMWGHLSREGGSGGYARGTGEQQIEIDRRLIDVRVAELRRKLQEVEKQRERMVSHRHKFPTVSLVGYTNAGKSTLMNALTGADVYVADKLFATLDTRTRSWKVPHLGEVLLSDTVGFIRNLPHHLVASFRSTLEEARHADLLLHVVDASHPAAPQHIAAVDEVLADLKIDNENMILVLNKSDAVEDRSLVDVLRSKYPSAVSVSARSGMNLDRLTSLVRDRFSGGYCDVELETGAGNGRLLSYLAQHADISEQRYHDECRMTIRCRIPLRYATGMPGEDVHVRPLNGIAWPGTHH